MVRVAATKGYEATTVTDVIEMAGVPRATFNEMFESKEACFMEAFDAVNDILVTHVTSAFEEADGPWPDRIVIAMRALVDLLSTESEVARMTMIEVIAAGEKGRERYRAGQARFAPMLEEGREYAAEGERLPPDTARFAVGGATSLIFDEIRAGRGDELERVLPDLVFAVLMPYLGPEAAEVEMRRVTIR
jgi:AcrR family transcriptional regulator